MRFVWALVLLLVLAGCAPAVFEPDAGAAEGVTLTMTEREEFGTFRLEVEPAIDRAFLRFVGRDLVVNAEECEVIEGAIECVIGRVESFYEVHVGGEILNDWDLPAGVVFRDGVGHALFLQP